MSTLPVVHAPWQFLPGTQPSTDSTGLSSNHFAQSQNIRYVRGKPEKLGGWQTILFEEGDALDGKCRTLFGGLISGKARTVIGSNTQLHSLIGSAVDDITPDGLAAGNAEDNIIGTPGNGGGLYEWDGDSTSPATAVLNAPTQINYAFVLKNIVVTFGDSGVENRIKTSDIGDRTVWTATSENQVFEDELEDVERLISHVVIQGEALIFTENATLLMEYTGGALVWRFTMIDPGIGIIGPLARCASQGVAYWMGRDNFYMWSGGNVEVIPSNSGDISTGFKYVFENINTAQKSKCFVWFNEKFSEVWFHYPSANSNECDRVARVNTHDFTWSFDEMDRTAAEWPYAVFGQPRLVSSDNVAYRHELTNDAGGEAMEWLLKTPKRFTGPQLSTLTGLIPDSVQTGDDVIDNWGVLDSVLSLESSDIGTPVTVQVQAWEWPQSSKPLYDETFTVTQKTERISLQAKGRVFQYTLRGQAIGQAFQLGQWVEEMQAEGGRR
jgi:hypothetical protein